MTWRLGHPILVAFVILVFGRQQQQQHQHSTVSIQKIHVFLSHDFCSALFTESACLESGLPAMIVFIPNSDGPWNGLQFCRILRRWTWRILRGMWLRHDAPRLFCVVWGCWPITMAPRWEISSREWFWSAGWAGCSSPKSPSEACLCRYRYR